MKAFKKISIGAVLILQALSGFSQNPNYVDPGNVRGDEGTVYLWENPTFYIPVLVVVIVVVALGIMRRKKNKS